MDIQSVTYKEIPDNKLKSKVLSNVSSTDMVVLTVAGLIMAASAIWVYVATRSSMQVLITVVCELVVVAILFLRTNDGFDRFYAQMVFGFWTSVKHSLFGGVWYKAHDTDKWLIRWLRNRNGKRPALPLAFTVIRAVLDGKVERVAVLRELDRPYDHVYFTCEGGSFVTHDPSMQMRMVDMLANITNQAVSMANLKLGITYLRIKSPMDESRLTTFFGTNMNPLIARPELFELDDETREWAVEMQSTLNELRPAARHYGGSRPVGVVKLTIKRDRKVWRQARGGKFSNEQLYDLPVVELSRSMAEALKAHSLFGFTNVKVLGLADLAKLMRTSLDVTDIQDYYSARAAGMIPRNDEEIEMIVAQEGVEGLNARLQCFPRESIEIGKNGQWMRIDNTYFSVLRISQLPRRARADQLLNIHHVAPLGVWTRVAVVGQSVSGNTETRNMILQSSALANYQQAFFANRAVDDPRRRRRREQMESQTEEISLNTIAQFFNILVVVAAGSERDVLRNRRVMKARLQGDGFESQLVDDVAYIQSAVISGVLGVNRL